MNLQKFYKKYEKRFDFVFLMFLCVNTLILAIIIYFYAQKPCNFINARGLKQE